MCAFCVTILLQYWKGYHYKDKGLHVHFHVKEVKTVKLELMDLAVVSLAVGITRNVFGTQTVKGLIKQIADKECFRAKPSTRSSPVFLARQSRGNSLTKRPMTLKAANEMFQNELRMAGLHSGETHANTLYAFRRTFATIVAHKINRMTARYFLGHGPSSKVLELHYDQNLPGADTSGALTGETHDSGANSRTPMQKR